MKIRISFLLLVVCGVCVIAAAADPYEVAERLATERNFDLAEAEYRRQLETRPQDWRLRIGLARVILWKGNYRAAERAFAPLVAERPNHAGALLGHAQAAYWNGDFRAARSRYARLLAAHPGHEEARKVLADLATLSAPRYEITAAHRTDSQPYRLSGGRAVVSWFSDPLTRWDLRGRAGDATGGQNTLGGIGAGVSAGLPRIGMRVDAWAERFRFADGVAEVIGEVSLTRDLPIRSEVIVAAERIPLLATATAVGAHPTATQYSVSWRRKSSERWLASASVHTRRYSDGNEGVGADAWGLAPIWSKDTVAVRGGLSAAYRNTDENRFRFTSFQSEPISTSEWQYTFTGVYDPYWTPHKLKEARLVLVAEAPRLKIHLDGGVARDEYLGFGPPSGFTQNPMFIFPTVLDRTFRPWRASAEVNWPLPAGLMLRARYAHDVTAFYRADEIEASLVGRF